MENTEPESMFDEKRMNKRQLKEFDKATHVVCEIQNIDNKLVETVRQIKEAKIVHISKNRIVSLAWVKKVVKPILSKVLSNSSFIKKPIYKMELRQLSIPFECFQNSTAFVIAKCTNPGIYSFFAGSRNDKFYYYATDQGDSTPYDLKNWKELSVEADGYKHNRNTKYSSA